LKVVPKLFGDQQVFIDLGKFTDWFIVSFEFDHYILGIQGVKNPIIIKNMATNKKITKAIKPLTSDLF